MSNDTTAQTHRSAGDEAPWVLGPGENGTQRLPVNMYETSDALVLVAPMPAVFPEDIEIAIEGTQLRMHAELRSAAPRDYLLHEWEYGLYERSLELPEGYGGDATATLGQGQLAISLSRGETSPQRRTLQPT